MIAPQPQTLLGLLPTCAEFLLTACAADQHAMTGRQRGGEAPFVTVAFTDHTESLLLRNP
ncbi:MAG: hypothetical protein KGK16_14370 [Bradyrhizobium sp.]|nr:hypothetical protein [Bradyrhizobium sp.]